MYLERSARSRSVVIRAFVLVLLWQVWIGDSSWSWILGPVWLCRAGSRSPRSPRRKTDKATYAALGPFRCPQAMTVARPEGEERALRHLTVHFGSLAFALRRMRRAHPLWMTWRPWRRDAAKPAGGTPALLCQRADVGDEGADLALLQPRFEGGHRALAVADLGGELLVGLLLHLGGAEVLRLRRLAGGRVRAAVLAVARRAVLVERGATSPASARAGTNSSRSVRRFISPPILQ